jgi:aminoglycoside phosphotransferase (APT) family kinase protein
MGSPVVRAEEAGILEALRSVGLLAAGENARLRPLAGGVSSDVFRVDIEGGRALAVKRSIPRLRVAADWRAPVRRWAGEVRWLRLVRSLDARLAPAVLAEVPEAYVFAMAFLDPATHPVWKETLAAGHIDPAFAGAVGRDLARIHAHTAGRADIAADFADSDCFHALRVSPFLLFTAERHLDLAPRLRALAEDLGTRRTALMHGDISPKNILIGPQGPVFLDAECVAYGDPAFDLAFCLTHLLLKTVWLKPHAEALMAAFEAFRLTYAAGTDWEAPTALDRRAAALVSALLLARVDGKSPAPYLTDAADQGFVRETARRLLAAHDLDLAGLLSRWRGALASW